MSHPIAGSPELDVRGMRVLVTGHTGFKGAWLCEWLLNAGATVTGIALPPESEEALFTKLRQGERLNHVVCDVRDRAALSAAIRKAEPEVIIHMAAQALVRRSYREPVLTWETNVIGTLNLLDGALQLGRKVSVVVVTSDKVYRNREWEFAYREDDELGGHDPYSASKAGCEIAVSSWRACFGSSDGVVAATARAGNVIGPGDISEDRIVPDCFRAWSDGQPVSLRQPGSTRPWQHVLEPLSGYLKLAAHLRTDRPALPTCNFGPDADGSRTVQTLVEALAAFDGSRRWTSTTPPREHEARSLALSIDRARHVLGWVPRLTFKETIEWTNEGYVSPSAELPRVVDRQIEEFTARVRA